MKEQQEQSGRINGYSLSRAWFDFAFENTSRVKPIHGALYFWVIELCNRMGWPREFANPASQCMAACGISSYNTYKKAFEELQEFGFVTLVKPSVNQWQACIIALSKIDESLYEALDKALAEHSTKHLQSTVQSTDSINKPLTLNNKPETESVLNAGENLLSSFGQFWAVYDKKVSEDKSLAYWIKMTPHQRQLALDNVAIFVQAYPKYRYRPNPLRYLEESMWKDELPTDGGESQYKAASPKEDTRDKQIPVGFENRWEKFTQWYKDQKFQYVSKISEQLTPIELEKLLLKASASVVMEKMLVIENARDKYSKNKSVYLTINNWLNRD